MAAARYRQFMKLCQEWPLDATKPGRDLGAVIRQKVAGAFKHGEMSQIDEVECSSVYDHLNKINSNSYRKKYARSVDTGATGATREQCTVVMSTEVMDELKTEDVGIFKAIKMKMGFKG